MDLKSMKRKELQALCKEHGIPANTTNSQMIEGLSSILLVKGKLKGCLKGSGGSSGEELGFVQGRAKKVTFVHQDEEKDEEEEFVVKAVGKSKRKSIGRRSSVVPEPAKSGGEINEDSSCESSWNVVEVPRRSTRSRGLAEAVVWSPVIEKKQKKKAADGIEGIRENVKVVSGKEKNKVSGGVPSIRSLRNRVVVAGRDEEVVTGQKPGKTQKRKFSDKGEHENATASMVEDKPAGRKNLRKRTRDEDTVEDEPPRRRSTRSHATLEETVAIEEVDVAGANKRKKAVEKEIEDTNLGGNISNAAVVKKAQSRGRPRASKQGDSEGVKFDGEAVAGPTRRSTRSSSSVSSVGKSDKKGDAVVKGKSQKQSEDRALKGGDSASILPVSVAQPEPVRRSTRSSSAVLEDEASLPAAGKSAKGGKAVKKGETKKQANGHGLEEGGSETSFPDTEVVAALTRRSTRNSSSLLENETSLPVGRHSVEEDEAIRKGKSQKQGGARASKEGVSTPGLSVNETITESARRSTRSSSRSSGNEVLFPAVGKLASVDEVIPNDTPGKKQGESDPKPEDPTSVHSARRSTRSSSKLSEDTILSPIVGKLSDRNNAVRKDKSEKQASVHASKRRDSAVSLPNSQFVITPTRRSTCSSSKVFEDEMPNNVVVPTPMRSKHSLSKSLEYGTLRKVKASDNDNEIKNDKSVKLSNNSESNLGDATPSVPEKEESVSTSARRSTRSSSTSFGDGISLQVESSGIYNEAVNEDKSGRKPKKHASKQRGSTASVLCSPVAPESLRRSTRSSLNHDSLKVETSLSLSPKVDNDDDSIQKSNPRTESETVKRKKIQKDQIEDDLKGQGSAATGFGFEAAAEIQALGVFEQCEEVSRRSTRSASKLDKSRVSVLFTPSSEIIETKQKKKRMRTAASKEDMLVVESETVGGSVSRDALQGSSTSSLRKSLKKVSADGEVVQGHCSLAPAAGLLEDEQTVPEVAQSPVNPQLQKVENDSSLGPKDLAAVCFDSHFTEKQSSFLEMTNEAGDALSSDFINDSSKLLESVSGKVASSNVDLPVEAEGTEESHGYDKDKDLAPAEFVFSTMKVTRSMETSVGALNDVDNIVGMESQNTMGPVIPLKSSDKPKAFHIETSAVFQFKEPNAQVEVDIDHEDVLRSKEATQISSPQSPFKSSGERLLTSDAETSAEVDHEEPKLKAEIHDSTGEDLEGNETTDIGETTFVDQSSEGLSPISDAAMYVEEPDSKIDDRSEDVMVGGEATKMIDRIITNTENSPRALCDLNIEGPDSKVEDHVMAKGGMVNSEDMNTAGSPFPCKSTGVLSPSLLPTLFNEVCPGINVGEPCLKVDTRDMSKVVSHSNAFLGEASDLHSETLEVAGKIKALGDDTDSYSCKASLEVIKETWVSSTSIDTVNDDGGKNDFDNNGDELKLSLPSESSALDLCSGQHLREDRSLSSPEEVENGSATLRCHDKEDLRHRTDQQGVGVDTTEHVHVDAVDRSLKSTAKEHDDAKPADVVADVLAEVADTTKKLSAVNIERSLELGAVVEEGMDTIESLESEANIEEAGNNAIENINGIGQSKSDHFDEGGQEFHAHDIGSLLSVEKSASIAGGENILSLENFETTYAESAGAALSKMDVVFSGKPQLEEDNMEKASAEKENPSSEEFPSSVSFILLPSQQENQESDGEKEAEVKTELSLFCNALEDPFSGLGEPREEERVHGSSIEPESNLEAAMNVEKHTASSTREGVSLVPADAFKCEHNNLNVVHTIAISEPGSEDADDPIIDNRVELRENSDYNAIIASSRTPDAKQVVDQGLNLSVCGMTLASGTTGIFENNECSPAANRSVVGSKDLSKSSSRESLARISNDSSIKAHMQDEKSDKYQDIPESFEQASNVEEAWVARGAHSMFVDDLFGMDGNSSAQVSQWGHHEDNLAHHSGRFSELSIAEALEMGDGKMKAVAVSGNSDAEREEAYECEMSPEAENFLSGCNKPCAEMDSEATYSAEQSGGQEERRSYIQEALDISRFTEDQNTDGLDGTKIEGSATRECTFDQSETITMTTVANQEELNARNCTNFADQVFFKENSGVKRSIENEFEYSTYQGIFTAQHSSVSLDQHSSVSLDTGAFRDTRTAMHDESIANKNELMAPDEYFDDFDRSFADFDDSNLEVREVNSQPPMESTIGKSPEHSKSGFDLSQEQNKSSDLDQIEEIKESVHSTPMQSYPLFDDVIRNKENAVGLKMDSSRNHIEKPISNSSRRPLQSLRGTKDEL